MISFGKWNEAKLKPFPVISKDSYDRPSGAKSFISRVIYLHMDERGNIVQGLGKDETSRI